MFRNHVLNDRGEPVRIDDKESWGAARMNGVSASDINKIVSPTLKISTQQEKLLEYKLGLKIAFDIPNSYTTHGNDREAIVLGWAAGNFNVVENRFLFHGENVQHFATPDGLGEDFVVEVKTSLKPLEQIRQGYMNQMQWQMHVIGVDKCLFLVEEHENFEAKGIDYEWIEKDNDRVDFLVENVNKFIARLNEAKTTSTLF